MNMKRLLKTAALAATMAMSAPVFAGYADDRAEIENVSNKYMVAVDAGDIETVMSTWAEDGVLEWVYGVEHGKEAIRKAMSGFGPSRLGGTCIGYDQVKSPEEPPTCQVAVVAYVAPTLLGDGLARPLRRA